MHQLTVPAAILDATFARLRDCGDGQRECVVYWAGPTDRPGTVDQVIHPDHVATSHSYELDQRWLNCIWFHLRAQNRQIRVQVHTHQGPAWHSPTDDRYPLLQTEGFLSLVLPRFATGPVGLEGSYLAELGAIGGWRTRRPHHTLHLEQS